MDPVPPHASWHGVLGRQALQRLGSGWVLTCKEEVMMLVEQGSVQGNEGLPLFVIEGEFGLILLESGGMSCGLLGVHLDALCFHHYKLNIDAFDLRNQLFMRYRLGQGLRKGDRVSFLSLDLKGARDDRC